MEEKHDYEIIELYQMLLKDESWEPDPIRREFLANMMYRSFVGRYPQIPKEEN